MYNITPGHFGPDGAAAMRERGRARSGGPGRGGFEPGQHARNRGPTGHPPPAAARRSTSAGLIPSQALAGATAGTRCQRVMFGETRAGEKPCPREELTHPDKSTMPA